MTLRVLFVQHVGLIGGSSRSLYELISNFDHEQVIPYVLCPPGMLASLLEKRSVFVERCIGLSQFDNTKYGCYKGIRWIVLLREIFLLLPTLFAITRIKFIVGNVDVVHVNEITMPFVVWLAKIYFPKSVIVVHSRSVQAKTNNFRSRFLEWFYNKHVDAIISIDHNVNESLPATYNKLVIHNGLTVPNITSTSNSKNEQFTVAMVGTLSRMKGCVDYVRAAAIVRERIPDVRFVFVGGSIRKNIGWKANLLSLLGLQEDVSLEINSIISMLNLENNVVLMPYETDIAKIYKTIDVLCFPSYLDAPGRPIFEAGFFGVPSIASISNPKVDTFEDGITGLLVPPKSPEAIAMAVLRLYNNPEERFQMGRAARQKSYDLFDARKNAQQVHDLYCQLLKLS